MRFHGKTVLGITAATILTLFYLPALYALWFRVKRDDIAKTAGMSALATTARSALFLLWAAVLVACVSAHPPASNLTASPEHYSAGGAMPAESMADDST